MSQKKFRAWETPRPMWDAIKDRVRENRGDPTEAEERLWNELRKLKAKGLHFRRQHSIGRFIVDFYCWKPKLAIEVDGPMHDFQRREDARRDKKLREAGVRVLRFTNNQVIASTDGVIEAIRREAERTARGRGASS